MPDSSPPGPLAIAYLGDANSVHLRRWAGHFADRGHRITLLVADDQVLLPGLPESIAVERYVPHTARRNRRLGMLDTRRSMRAAVARVRPDILHVHHLTVYGMRAWMSGFHPYVMTVWGSDVLITARRGRRARLLARLTLRSADLVTGISRHLVDAAIRVGARPELARAIHFGIDVERFSPGPDAAALRERLGLAGRRIVFSPRTIGRLYRQDVVIRALEKLPEDVVVVMTRHLADPAEAARVEALVGELGLGARVVIVPTVAYADMPDFYRLAEVVVSVPESDSGPITLAEALACGRPCVSSDLPPVREWLGEMDPACLVPVGDAEATAAAVLTVMARSPQERVRFAGLGRAAACERADQRRTMAEVEALYRDLAAGRSVSAGRGAR
jgi:glycosyltransferase involved in cell wall biosynthesis